MQYDAINAIHHRKRLTTAIFALRALIHNPVGRAIWAVMSAMRGPDEAALQEGAKYHFTTRLRRMFLGSYGNVGRGHLPLATIPSQLGTLHGYFITSEGIMDAYEAVRKEVAEKHRSNHYISHVGMATDQFSYLISPHDEDSMGKALLEEAPISKSQFLIDLVELMEETKLAFTHYHSIFSDDESWHEALKKAQSYYYGKSLLPTKEGK